MLFVCFVFLMLLKPVSFLCLFEYLLVPFIYFVFIFFGIYTGKTPISNIGWSKLTVELMYLFTTLSTPVILLLLVIFRNFICSYSVLWKQ